MSAPTNGIPKNWKFRIPVKKNTCFMINKQPALQ